MVNRFPTKCGNMTRVDSKGRIVLPQELRERLGISPGSEVDMHEVDGKIIVEPELEPGRIIDRMNQLVEESSAKREESVLPARGISPRVRKHRTMIQRGAEIDDR